MKNRTLWILYFIVFCFGIYYAYIMLRKEIRDHKNAPKIDYSSNLNLVVKKISFERNGLFLNDIEYNSSGISGYSKFQGRNSSVRFGSIKVPYIIKKENNNDTLKIIKNEKEMYLLVTKEIEYRKNGGSGY